jgi:hypothetical protein
MGELRESVRPTLAAGGGGFTRRRALMLLVGGVAGGAVVGACSSDGPSESATENRSSSDPGETTTRPPAGGSDVVMYSSPSCGCCGEYADYLRAEGYTVDLQRVDDLDAVRAGAGVPEEAAGCHTAMFDDYVVEGHVPLEAIDQLLRERPEVAGIALPGMPAGSPGMGGTKDGPFEILSFDAGEVQPYTSV